MTRNILQTGLFLLLLIIFGEAILDRTYYDILEVPVSANQQQIRQAFRYMSKKYHPDRNPQSRERFGQINVAYEVLYNAQKKYLYDRVGREKLNDPNVYHQMHVDSMKGPQLKIKVFLELKDFYLGKELDVMVEKQIACPHCKGTGAQNPYDIVNCGQCQGKGRITRRVDLGGGYYNMFTQTCPRCQGKGKVIGRKCHVCKSQKIIPGIQEFTLKIKPGTQSNSQLRYTNMGDQRLIGAPSDIVFQLVEIKHKYLERRSQHLFTQIYIGLQEAILGFTKTIIHLDGHQVQIKRQDITQPGFVMIMQGEGMPLQGSEQKGNMYVTIRVLIPQFNDDELNVLQDFFSKRKN